MKEFWVRIPEKLSLVKKKDILKKSTAICDVILVSDEDVNLARGMGARKVASPSKGDIHISRLISPEEIGTLKLHEGNSGVEVTVQSGKDESLAILAAEAGAEYVLVSCPNWKVIPLENLIAKIPERSRLVAEVSDLEEARSAFETLEIGTDGILLKANDSETVEEVAEVVRSSENHLKLTEAKVTSKRPLATGARVCVDTCDIMKHGEGILVGCQSLGLFLIQAEVQVNPHVETRPFRVNAGPVSSYVLTPGNRTRYLSELKAGDEVLIVDRNGRTRTANIGRIKIESRPMMLIEAESQDFKIKTITQNAETIHLVTPDGSISVSELKVGDTVIARLEEGGRHFGTLVRGEMVIER